VPADLTLSCLYPSQTWVLGPQRDTPCGLRGGLLIAEQRRLLSIRRRLKFVCARGPLETASAAAPAAIRSVAHIFSGCDALASSARARRRTERWRPAERGGAWARRRLPLCTSAASVTPRRGPVFFDDIAARKAAAASGPSALSTLSGVGGPSRLRRILRRVVAVRNYVCPHDCRC
jgi:hypothetical protein